MVFRLLQKIVQELHFQRNATKCDWSHYEPNDELTFDAVSGNLMRLLLPLLLLLVGRKSDIKVCIEVVGYACRRTQIDLYFAITEIFIDIG